MRVRLSASACALPRPSATASAKLANSTVNHSHKTIWNSNPRFAPPVTMSRINITVVSANGEVISEPINKGFVNKLCEGAERKPTDNTAGRSLTIAFQLSPESAEQYTCPPVVPK